MDGDGASQNSTQVLERSFTPQEHAQKVRDELEGLGEMWEKVGAGADLKSAIITAAARATVDHLCPQKRARRRLSVLDRTDAVVHKVTSTVAELNSLWDQIDMDEQRRLNRVETAYEHVEKLLSEMVSSEYAMVTAIQDQIVEFTGKVAEMRRELGLSPFNMRAHTKGSIAQWKALEADMKQLNEDRAALIEEQKAVIDRFAHVTSRLGSDLSDETTASLPDSSVLAPRTTVSELRDRCVRMEQLLAERVQKVEEVQKEINMWIHRMKCDYDENVAAVLEVDARAPESALTGDLMSLMEETRQTIADSYAEWLSGREFDYHEKIIRLQELWEMCCVGDDERRLPAQFDPALLDSCEEARSEVARLEASYERRKEVFEKIGAWKTHWEQKLQFERSENSLDKYNNRGGSLEQNLKFERSLRLHLLPHAIQAVADSYTTFLRAHPQEKVLIQGMEPLAYINHVTGTHDLEKEMEKEQKAEAKKAQLMKETKWGSVPSKTPLGIRRPLGPASSASRAAPAAKMPRIAAGIAMGSTDEAGAANFTFDQSAISSISPKRKADQIFPKTSSPKGSRVTVAPGTRFANPAAPSPAKGFTQTPKRPLTHSNKK